MHYNPTEITEYATALGLTRRVASTRPDYECWADRVLQAWAYELDVNHALNQRDVCGANEYAKRRDEAMVEANRYALTSR